MGNKTGLHFKNAWSTMKFQSFRKLASVCFSTLNITALGNKHLYKNTKIEYPETTVSPNKKEEILWKDKEM